jgi:hypothetical protein
MIIFSHMDCTMINEDMQFCLVIAAFRWFWPHVLCMLIVCRPESCCMCVYNTHARSSADSFTVGSGVWSVFVMFSLAYFGTQLRILFPAKRYFEDLTVNILAAKIFAYTVPKQMACISNHRAAGNYQNGYLTTGQRDRQTGTLTRVILYLEGYLYSKHSCKKIIKMV